VRRHITRAAADPRARCASQAGCGTGSLAIPLALKGATVVASDISSVRARMHAQMPPRLHKRCIIQRCTRASLPSASPDAQLCLLRAQSMASEAQRRYDAEVASGAAPPSEAPKFFTSDLESVTGKYHTVTCLDVMIHYPQEKADAMVQHLASLADKRLIISFAPKTLAYTILKRIGELFPGPSKATRAYLHAEADVEAAAAAVGWKVKRREMTATNFYFSRLLEFQRA
jgi:magnesium-protoporphyrin O-methyltransferase